MTSMTTTPSDQPETRRGRLQPWRGVGLRLLDIWHLPPDVILIGTALAVGLLTGLGAVVFRYLVTGVTWIGYTWLPSLVGGGGRSTVVYVPAIGGLIVGLLVYRYAREAKGHGVPEVMEAVALRGGRIRPIVAIVKAVASAVCIGSGGSAGREGPIVQIGSSIGSSIGQALHLSDNRIRNLVACGAASGIAATFNTPVAGVMFALEVILGEFGARYLSTVVVAAVAASVVGQAAFGNVPAFPIPAEYGFDGVGELGLYVILAFVAAITGAIFVKLLYGSEDLFDRWTRVPEWVKPAVGGLLLGLLALAYPIATGVTWERVPQVYNVGYDTIELALASGYGLNVVIVLLLMKILATSLTLGSGGSGGVFAPSLFMGAMLGSAFALLVNALVPTAQLTPGAFALVGMAAVFAATSHAPITAFLILFELTGDYGLILPLMLAVIIASMTAQRILGGDSIYTMKLSRRGVRLRAGRDIDVMNGVDVAEAMTRDVIAVSTSTSLAELSDIIGRERKLGFPVLDPEGRLWGVVTVSDLDRAYEARMAPSTPVDRIGTTHPHLQVAFPDESLGTAMSRMGARGVGRLPVVDRDQPDRMIGVLRRDDVFRMYNAILSRREELDSRISRMRLGDRTGVEFIELRLTSDDRPAGRAVHEVFANTPAEWILVSVRRDGHTLIPHGDTILQAGDLLTVAVHKGDALTVTQQLRGQTADPPDRA